MNPLTTSCPECHEPMDVEDLLVHEETDHEIWMVMTCPKCGSEVGRERKYQGGGRGKQNYPAPDPYQPVI